MSGEKLDIAPVPARRPALNGCATRLGLLTDKERGQGLQSVPIEKIRLQTVYVFMLISDAAYLPHSWLVQYRVTLAHVLVLRSISGFCIMCVPTALHSLAGPSPT